MVFKPIVTPEMVNEIREMRNNINTNESPLPRDTKCKIIDGKKVWYQEIDNDVIVIRRG